MNLKNLRKEKNITQEKVAKDLNVGRASYNRYELGLTEPDIETLKKMADYFHVSVDEVIGHEIPFMLNRAQFSEKQLEIIENIQNLSDEDCRYILASITAIKIANQEKENVIKKFKQ